MSEDHLLALMSFYLFSTASGIFFGIFISIVMLAFRGRGSGRDSAKL